MPKRGTITLVGPLTAYPTVPLMSELGGQAIRTAQAMRIKCWQVVKVEDTNLLHCQDLVGERLYDELMEHGPEKVVCQPAKLEEWSRYISTVEDWEKLKKGTEFVRGEP